MWLVATRVSLPLFTAWEIAARGSAGSDEKEEDGPRRLRNRVRLRGELLPERPRQQADSWTLRRSSRTEAHDLMSTPTIRDTRYGVGGNDEGDTGQAILLRFQWQLAL